MTAGTVIHGIRTPLRLWFWVAYLVATQHPGIAAKQLQRQLSLTRFETAWQNGPSARRRAQRARYAAPDPITITEM